MSATVSVWVPLAVAGAGVASTFGAAVLTRWSDHRERREQWRREDAVRWYQERQQACVRLMAALDEWHRGLGSAAMTLDIDTRTQVHTEIDMDELARLGEIASKASALVQLMAPRAVSSLAQTAIKEGHAVKALVSLTILSRAPGRQPDLSGLNARWALLHSRTSRLREAMRDDLGIESKQGDAASAGATKGT